MDLEYYHKILQESELAIESVSPDRTVAKTVIKLSNGTSTTMTIYLALATEELNNYRYDNIDYYKFVSGKGSSPRIKSIITSYIDSKRETLELDQGVKNIINHLEEANLYVDALTNQAVVAKNGIILPYSLDVYMSVKGIDKKDLFLNALTCRIIYAPRVEDRFFEDVYPGYDDKVLHINTFHPQDWKKVPTPVGPVSQPQEFCELIEHLIPLEADRDFFIHWFYRSLIARARTFLILCGDPGVGKTTVKDVFKAVHGPDNTVDGKKSTLSGQFNAQLAFGTLMWFDELKYSEENENFMKEMPNDTMAIEFKGVDTTRSTELNNSYVISNNKPRDNYIAMDSRKFAPIGITNVRLDKIWSSSKIDNFRGKLNPRDTRYDVEFVAHIAHWILQEGPKYDGRYLNDEYSSRRLQELRHTSLSKWKRRLVTMLEHMDERGIPHEDLGKITSETFKKFRIKSVNYELIEEWFDKYSAKGKTKLLLPDETTVMSFLRSYVNLDGKAICFVDENEVVHKIGPSTVVREDEEEEFEEYANPIDAL